MLGLDPREDGGGDGGAVRVAEGEGQGSPCCLLEALAQEADKLRLEDAFQEAVGRFFLEDEEVVLPRAEEGQEDGGGQRWARVLEGVTFDAAGEGQVRGK